MCSRWTCSSNLHGAHWQAAAGTLHSTAVSGTMCCIHAACCFLDSWAVDCCCTAQVRCSRALERLHVILDQWKEQMYMLTITQSNPETLAEGAVCGAGVCESSTA
jgi:hypothetical protein